MSDTPQLVLIGQTLTSFSSGLSSDEQRDILDCLSYSQTRADRKYSRRDDWKMWINRYQAGLYNNGFKIGAALVTDTVEVSRMSEVPDVLRSMAEGSGHDELASLGRSALSRMLTSSQAHSFFQGWDAEGFSESLQVVPCRKRDSGDVEVLFCGVRLTTQTLAGLEPGTSRSGMRVSLDGAAYVFSEAAYAGYREAVTARLEAYTRIYFDSLADR